MIADLDDVVVLLRAALDFDSPQDLKVAEEGIKCYQACHYPGVIYHECC